MDKALQDEIVDFMFLRDATGNLLVLECLQLWFGKSGHTDIEIEDRFGTHVVDALHGKLDHWRITPRGCLALMILVDQFPRNIYRHTISMFSGDAMSRHLAYSSGHDWLRVLKPEECLFMPCLVMTHQENIEDQEYCLKFYASIERLLPPSLHVFHTIFEEHYRIIKLCGSFPHRDHYYNRITSARGKVLLDNPTIRFDLPLCIADDGKIYFGRDPAKLWLATKRAFDVVDRLDALINHSAQLTRSPVSPTTFMTPKRCIEVAEIFRTFDTDGSGVLELGELGAVLLSTTGHNYSDVQLQDVVDAVTGCKGSAGLTRRNLARILHINLGPTSEQQARARRWFDRFDADRSGDISLAEFTASIQGLDCLMTTAEAAAMFQSCDRDGSGSVFVQEFMEVLERRLSVG